LLKNATSEERRIKRDAFVDSSSAEATTATPDVLIGSSLSVLLVETTRRRDRCDRRPRPAEMPRLSTWALPKGSRAAESAG